MSEKLKQVTGGLNQVANKIRAYHGSPHKFDKFDISKIGSGEGAQAYGHGMYFAENPEVAKEYKKNLSRAHAIRHADPEDRFEEEVLRQVSEWGNVQPAPLNIDLLYAPRGYTFPELRSAFSRLYEKGLRKNPGYIYEVDLSVPREHLLDWDAPLSQQTDPVREMLSFDRRAQDKFYDNGGEYYRALMSRAAQDAPVNLSASRAENWAWPIASRQLLERGIPGIQYLDEGSRSRKQFVAPGEEFGATRNIVMFDDAPIEIVERKAKGGAVEGDGIPVPPEIAQQILGQGFANGGPVDWESYAEQAQVATNPVTSPVAPQPAPAAPAPEQAIESGMSRLAPQASTPGAEIGSPMSQPQQDAPRAIGTGLNTPGTLGSALGTLGGAGMIGGIGGSLIGASLANRDLERIGAPERIGPMQAALAGAAGPFAGLFGLERPQQAFNDIVTRSFMPDDYTQIIGRLEPQVGQDLPQDNTAPAPGFSSVVDPGERSGYGWE